MAPGIYLENSQLTESSLAGSLCYKFGYGSDLAKFKKEAKKFSLLEDGTLDKECTRLLLVNVYIMPHFSLLDLTLIIYISGNGRRDLSS